jgi:hypothetical protein
MSIKGKVDELNSIKGELKSLRTRGAILRKRAKQIEDEIDEYLDLKDQPGLKYKGTAIVRDTTTKRRVKKKDEQKSDAIYVLERHGINSPEKVLQELIESRRGSPTEQRKLKFKKIKKKKGEDY